MVGRYRPRTNTPDTVIRVPVALADFSTFGWVRDDEVGFHHRNIRRTRSEWWEAGLENLPSPARSMFHVARSLLLPRWGNGRPHTEIARAARLLDLYIDRHRDAGAEVWIQHRVGSRREMVAAYPYAAFLLGEARTMLREPRRAEAAFLRVIACQDARSVDQLYARRHLVKLYDGPLDNRGSATRVCHDIIAAHGSTPVSDELTERWADVEAAEKIVLMWSRPPVDAARLLVECAAITSSSDDPAVRHIAAAGAVRSHIALGHVTQGVDAAIAAIHGSPTVVRSVDSRAPWPHEDVHTRRNAARLVEERRAGGDNGDGPGRMLAIDYAYYPLAALVDGVVTTFGDYRQAAGALAAARDALAPMSSATARYVRYLWLMVREEGVEENHPEGMRGRTGPGANDPTFYQAIQGGASAGPGRAAPMWDPLRRVVVDGEYVRRKVAEWTRWGGYSGAYYGTIGPEGAIVRAGLHGAPRFDRHIPPAEQVRVLRKSAAVDLRAGAVGRWTKVAWGNDDIGWVFDADIDEYSSGAGFGADVGDYFSVPLFGAAPVAPSAGSGGDATGARAPAAWRDMVTQVIPYLGWQKAVVADVNGDRVPDLIAAGQGVLVAIDGHTRRMLWVHRREAGSVPTVSDGAVFVEDTHDGGQHACVLVAATGAVRWRSQLRWHAAPAVAAPAVHDRLVFFRGEAGLSAYTLDKGAVRWRRPAVHVADRVTKYGSRLVVLEVTERLGDHRMSVVHSADGALVADLGWADELAVLPAVGLGLPQAYRLNYVETASGESRQLHPVYHGHAHPLYGSTNLPAYAVDGTYMALLTEVRDPFDGRVVGTALTALRRKLAAKRAPLFSQVWEHRSKSDFIGEPVIAKHGVYVASADGSLHALSRSDGRPLWDYRLAGPSPRLPARAEDWTPITVAQDRVIMGWGGDLYVFTPRDLLTAR